MEVENFGREEILWVSKKVETKIRLLVEDKGFEISDISISRILFSALNNNYYLKMNDFEGDGIHGKENFALFLAINLAEMFENCQLFINQ